MNYSAVCMILLVTGSLCLTALIHKRRKEEAHLARDANFEDIKNKVTKDVLGETLDQMSKSQGKLDKMKKNLVELRDNLQVQQGQADNVKLDAQECRGEVKHLVDVLADLEGHKSSLNTEFEKQQQEWTKDIDSLKQEISQKSKVCDYIIKTSDEAKKLCGTATKVADEPKKEEPKQGDKSAPPAEEPKKEEPKEGDEPAQAAGEPKNKEPQAEAKAVAPEAPKER